MSAINPTSNDSPIAANPFFYTINSAMTTPTNTGHAATTIGCATDFDTDGNTQQWYNFANIAGVNNKVLKINYNTIHTVGNNQGTAQNVFEYSLNNGSAWNAWLTLTNSSQSGTLTQALSAGQDMSQVRVREGISGFGPLSSTRQMSSTVSNVRIEFDDATGSSGGMM